jgi:hypothetical protein
VNFNIDDKISTQKEMEAKLPNLLLPAYEVLHKILTDCGALKKEPAFDNQSVKVIINSILKVQKSLDSKDAGHSVKQVIEDLSQNFSADVAQ